MSLAGFSSRSYSTQITQLPQRDEALMFDFEPGFSNSKSAKADSKAVDEAVTEDKVVASEQVEDKAVKPAKKAAAKKTAKRA